MLGSIARNQIKIIHNFSILASIIHEIRLLFIAILITVQITEYITNMQICSVTAKGVKITVHSGHS